MGNISIFRGGDVDPCRDPNRAAVAMHGIPVLLQRMVLRLLLCEILWMLLLWEKSVSFSCDCFVFANLNTDNRIQYIKSVKIST